jgi:YesN/AraC family two-component response regulator
MAQTPFDVVITDMRMPGMDGAQLLDLVKVKFPRTVRIILSGQSDRETILRSVGPAISISPSLAISMSSNSG